MNRLLESFTDLKKLPDSFGIEAYRAGDPEKGLRIILLVIPLPEGEDELSELYNSLARDWARLSQNNPSLARPVRWFLENRQFYLLLEDLGGPLLADELKKGCDFQESLSLTLGFLENWDQLNTQGYAWNVFDPTRIIHGSMGYISFDFIHLFQIAGAKPLGGNTFVTLEDLSLLSPEMTGRTNLKPGYRSGFYSLGTHFYRMVTGSFPLVRLDFLELIHAILNVVPDYSSPELLRQGVVFLGILQKLLQKDPQLRYQSLRGLKWDLKQCSLSVHENFIPGEYDQAVPISEIKTIYGRTRELKILKKCLNLVHKDQAPIVLLQGAGGQGKSSLLDNLRESLDLGSAGWIQGKYDQYDSNFNSGPLIQYLERWSDHLQILETGELELIIAEIRSRMGRNLGLVASLIPGFESLLGDIPEVVELALEESRSRLINTLVTLVGISLRGGAPTILVLEDIHWADKLNLRILETLAQARFPKLGIILTCRPGILEPNAGIYLLFPTDHTPERILLDLKPLQENDLFDLLQDSCRLEDAERGLLAGKLFHHSSGNPLAVRMLIQEINRRQALEFDEFTGKWRIQEDQIRDLPYQEELLEQLSQRLLGLSQDLRRALLCSSLLGRTFKKVEVLMVGELEPSRFDQLVAELQDLGVWELQEEETFRFTHDRIRQITFEKATEDERIFAHLRVGILKLNQWLKGGGLSPSGIAWHMNQSRKHLTMEGRKHLFGINILAGDESRKNGDYEAALGFYEAAVEEGGEEIWIRDAPKAWELYKSTAEVAYSLQNRILGDNLCERVLHNCGSEILRASIRERQQSFYFYLGDPEASIRVGIQGLRDLGIKFPSNPGLPHVVAALVKVKFAMRGLSAEELGTQSTNLDLKSRTAMRILCGFIPPAFLSGRQNLFGLAALTAVSMSLKDGLCAESAPSFTGYAVLLAALGDLKGAYKMGKLAVEINERFDDQTWRSMVLTLTGLFCYGWFEPWSNLKPRFEAARKASEDSGDMLYRTFAYLFTTLWNPNQDIPQRLQETSAALALIIKNRYPLTRVSAYLIQGSLRNLSEVDKGPLDFDSPEFDSKQGLEENYRMQSFSGVAVAHSVIFQTAFLLGDLDLAKEQMLLAERYRSAVAGSLYEEELTLYSGLVNADLVRRGERKSLKRLKSCGRQGNKWASQSSLFRIHSHLLQGERWDLENQFQKAQEAFLAAIEAADEEDFLRYQALTRERAFLFFHRHNLTDLAKIYLRGALDHYHRYGAWRKVELLEQSYNLVKDPSWSKASHLNPGDTSRNVDLKSLILALEAISGEINSGKLLKAVAKIILENSGASRVLIFLLKDQNLILEWEAAGTGVVPGEGKPARALPDIPQSYLMESLSTHQVVVKEFPNAEERRIEPLWDQRGLKSLIVLPIQNQDGLQLLIYLENTSMPGVLTRERLKMVELLSSTIAIAHQNALLFQKVREVNDSLEKRVEERTQELIATQKKIILQEKLASLGTLTAGIAHELKNPLNIINNFSESSIELFTELEEKLQGILDTMNEELKGDVEYLLKELSQNMKDILTHGQRGDGIIRSMLMHSRKDVGVTRPESLESLIRESFNLSFHGIRAVNPDFSCNFVANLDPSIPPIEMVRSSLGRVLINLFNNAHYSILKKKRSLDFPEYAPMVEVRSTLKNQRVRIEVEDNGLGIPEAIQEKIFQPFFTTKPPGEGTGLGLSISFEIIRDEFNGTMEVKSKESCYTRFVIEFPVKTPLN